MSLKDYGVVNFIFIQIKHSRSKQWRLRSNAASVVSDLVLHCLHMPFKKDALCFYWLSSSYPARCVGMDV